MSAHDRDALPPDSPTDAEVQRRLARLMDDTAPPLPTDEQWADVLARIERDLAAPPARPRSWSRRVFAATAVLAVAAVVVLAVALQRPPADQRTPNDALPEDPWPVASADDVLILSMDDRDRGALVVGEPPVNESLVLMAADEVKVENVQPDGLGRRGQLFVSKDSGIPMMIMSLGPDPEEDP